MIPLCSRFDSVLFTPKMSAIASCGNYSRFPYVNFTFSASRSSVCQEICSKPPNNVDRPQFRVNINLSSDHFAMFNKEWDIGSLGEEISL